MEGVADTGNKAERETTTEILPESDTANSPLIRNKDNATGYTNKHDQETSLQSDNSVHKSDNLAKYTEQEIEIETNGGVQPEKNSYQHFSDTWHVSLNLESNSVSTKTKDDNLDIEIEAGLSCEEKLDKRTEAQNIHLAGSQVVDNPDEDKIEKDSVEDTITDKEQENNKLRNEGKLSGVDKASDPNTTAKEVSFRINALNLF